MSMEFRTIEVCNRIHVLVMSDGREYTTHEAANYRGTGMALCGVLRKNENVNEFISKLKTKKDARKI